MKNSYDKRIVNYEAIHQLTKTHFDLFVDAIDPQPNDTILDVGAGYGAATREMMIRNVSKSIHYSLLEKSKVQVERARKSLSELASPAYIEQFVQFHLGALQDYSFEDARFDTVVAKSLIHEIPETQKVECFKKVYRMLKDKGRFIIWNYLLDGFNAQFIRKMIRKKDELSGFDELVSERHFPTETQVYQYLYKAGFKTVEKLHTFTYTHHSKYRLGEFGHNEEILTSFNRFIDELLVKDNPQLKEHLNFRKEGNDTMVDIQQSILVAHKT